MVLDWRWPNFKQTRKASWLLFSFTIICNVIVTYHRQLSVHQVESIGTSGPISACSLQSLPNFSLRQWLSDWASEDNISRFQLKRKIDIWKPIALCKSQNLWQWKLDMKLKDSASWNNSSNSNQTVWRGVLNQLRFLWLSQIVSSSRLVLVWPKSD